MYFYGKLSIVTHIRSIPIQNHPNAFRLEPPKAPRKMNPHFSPPYLLGHDSRLILLASHKEELISTALSLMDQTPSLETDSEQMSKSNQSMVV